MLPDSDSILDGRSALGLDGVRGEGERDDEERGVGERGGGERERGGSGLNVTGDMGSADGGSGHDVERMDCLNDPGDSETGTTGSTTESLSGLITMVSDFGFATSGKSTSVMTTFVGDDKPRALRPIGD